MQPSHLDHVRNDAAYADILAGWDAGFYSKYTRSMKPSTMGGRVLDIGCGVGQVVACLSAEGFEAHGVDVAPPNIERAQKASPLCLLYDGKRLPYPSDHFNRVGALNVLEHVQDPEGFIREAIRVCAPGGRIILSSPNFYRVLGFRDYHPRMRGVANKLRNAKSLFHKWRQMRADPSTVRFERMTPIIKSPFTPDDDAIVATNTVDMAFFLQIGGCRVLELACTDRDVPWVVDKILNLTPLNRWMFNAWVVAEKPAH
ncbi:MAG TPA: class I SAM-dependent methyltransferase [Candidatus Limnocylindria bacterium]|jgi:SAM-dependent methyltransferase|nr:class I SAM-dependent methyltransferase [Candidatus Limnocylindria bacterium]